MTAAHLIAYAWIATVVVTIGFTNRRGLPFRAAVDVTAAPSERNNGADLPPRVQEVDDMHAK